MIIKNEDNLIQKKAAPNWKIMLIIPQKNKYLNENPDVN